MKEMKTMYYFAAIAAIVMASVMGAACSKDDDTGGGLSGTSWSITESESNSVLRSEYTRTITFTSKDAGTYTKTGWYQISTMNGIKITWGSKKTDSETDNFTYLYVPEKVEGYNGYITIGGTEYPFSISDDGKSLSWTYYRKTFTAK
jgi:hypothetical protein